MEHLIPDERGRGRRLTLSSLFVSGFVVGLTGGRYWAPALVPPVPGGVLRWVYGLPRGSPGARERASLGGKVRKKDFSGGRGEDVFGDSVRTSLGIGG